MIEANHCGLCDMSFEGFPLGKLVTFLHLVILWPMHIGQMFNKAEKYSGVIHMDSSELSWLPCKSK